MPSNTLTNLKTSAAAAFCARLLVHPLDNARVSVQCSKCVPRGLVPRLKHILTNCRRELRYQQRRRLQHRNSSNHRCGERVSVYQGLYKGISFALVCQVPALAFFLSTYDASKHALASLAQSANMPHFGPHNSETHLLSGMIAKAAGTVIWAPMNRIQSLATNPATGHAPLSLAEAYRLARRVCRSEGVSRLWSGYNKSLSTLLPYTMIYFATYEQFKMLARSIASSRASETTILHGPADNRMDYWAALREYRSMMDRPDRVPAQTELALDTYMMCISSAVIVSSIICHTSSAMHTAVFGRHVSPQQLSPALSSSPFSARDHFIKNPQPLPNFVDSLRKHSMSNSPALSPTKTFPSTYSAMALTGAFNQRYPPLIPVQFRALMSSASAGASQTLAVLPWQQSHHATLTAPSLLPFRNAMAHKCISNPTLRGLVHPWPSTSWQPIALIKHNNAPPIQASITTDCTTAILNRTYKPCSSSGHLVMTTTMGSAMSSSCNDYDMNKFTNTSRNATKNNIAKTNHTPPGIVRTILRGLGPRILWTVPGVTLTTAGFEILRNMSTGCT